MKSPSSSTRILMPLSLASRITPARASRSLAGLFTQKRTRSSWVGTRNMCIRSCRRLSRGKSGMPESIPDHSILQIERDLVFADESNGLGIEFPQRERPHDLAIEDVTGRRDDLHARHAAVRRD